MYGLKVRLQVALKLDQGQQLVPYFLVNALKLGMLCRRMQFDEKSQFNYEDSRFLRNCPYSKILIISQNLFCLNLMFPIKLNSFKLDPQYTHLK